MTGPPSHPKPSQVTDVYWLYAAGPRGRWPESAERVGKWLVFVSAEHVDAVWARIQQATEAGRLGIAAKVATARPNPNATSRDSRVICIYTYDCEDEADVMRVRGELRRLGIARKIPYKTDADTLAGKYSARGDTQIARYFA
jgi:hypothetical protein